jgi:glycosylphosphatidylinositol transamidase
MAPPTTLRSIPIPTALFNPNRIRSYILRLPLFTRAIILVVLIFWVLELQTVWSVIEWGSLKPSQIGIFTGGMYRLNTFVFVHLGLLHMVLNLVILVPLMERFEREFGTLTSLALFVVPLATIPAGLYLVIESMVFRGDTAVVGSR